MQVVIKDDYGKVISFETENPVSVGISEDKKLMVVKAQNLTMTKNTF